MADKAIGSLVEATVINDADRFVLEQSGQAKQISGATMISELAEALDGHGGIQSIDLVSGDGNVKTYRITFTDGTTYDYEVRDGESGNYAVVAGNLAPYTDASGATQSIPFLSQGTGRGNGSATVPAGNYCQLKKKLGNTVSVNQPIKHAHFDATTNWINLASVSGGVGTSVSLNKYVSVRQDISAVSGHKYLISATATADSNRTLRLCFFDGTSSLEGINIAVTAGTYASATGIVTLSGNANRFALANWSDGATIISAKEIIYIDLTLWFGSNDNIPADLLSHPENWGRYYAGSLALNTGTLESADGAVLTSIGRNFFDKSKATAHAQLTNDGTIYAHSSLTCSVSDYTPVSPNTDVYFKDVFNLAQKRTICWYDIDKNFVKADGIYASSGAAVSGFSTSPPNAHFVRCTIPDVDTCVFSLYYSGESGYSEYYPYSVLAEVDTGSEVLRSAGSVADEKASDGTITRRVGYVDMGTLNWTAISRTRFETSTPISGLKYNPSAIQLSNIQCGRYETVPFNTMYQTDTDKCISAYNESAYIQVRDTLYANAAAFKAAMSGIYLYYELATPTTEQGTAFPENIPCAPVGSMSWENTKGIPQGAEIFYPYDYAGTLDSMIDALPSANGTYTFKATVANGKITYSWVADE